MVERWKTSATGEEPRTYLMAFLAKGGPWICPVEGCPGQAATRTAMQVHFMHRHFLDIVVILEEGNPPHSGCPRCDMMFPWRTLNGRHSVTAHCAMGLEQKWWQLAEADLRDIT